MQSHESHHCPRCDYPLLPVFAAEKGLRRVIALTCPEPYCDHMQMVTREEASRVTLRSRASARTKQTERAAN